MRDVKPEPIPQEVLEKLNKKPKQTNLPYVLGFLTGIFIILVIKLIY